MAKDKLLKVSYAVLDKKGRIAVDAGSLIIFKTKALATDCAFPEEGETVKKVSIYEA